MASSTDDMSNLEYHVLLALADGPRYGYGITDAVAEESRGSLTPRAGTLYRVIARLITHGWVSEVPAPATDPPHPGLARKYYGLTDSGRDALAEEARRLRAAADLAEERLGLAGGGG